MSDNPPILDLTAGDEPEAIRPPEVLLSEEELATPPARPGEVVLPEDEDDDEGLPKHAVLLEGGRILLPLKYPVTLTVRIGNAAGQEKIFTELKLRRLNGLDRKTANSQPEDMRTITLLARSAGLRIDLFNALYENMDGADTAFAERVLAHFLGLGPATGR